MSVLIKGMEMPKHAGVNEDKDTVYRCIVIAHPDNSAELVIDTEFASPYDNGHNVKRYSLVEVPTPHGTLIDKEVAIETFKEVYCGHCKKEIPCFACSVPIALDVLNDIPTIIEAEVSENECI